MRFAAALSTEATTARAIEDVCRQGSSELGVRPDLAVLFASHHHGGEFDRLAAESAEKTGACVIIGCTGEAIVGAGREIEEAPAVSLWLAQLPGVRIAPMQLDFRSRRKEARSSVGPTNCRSTGRGTRPCCSWASLTAFPPMRCWSG